MGHVILDPYCHCSSRSILIVLLSLLRVFSPFESVLVLVDSKAKSVSFMDSNFTLFIEKVLWIQVTFLHFSCTKDVSMWVFNNLSIIFSRPNKNIRSLMILVLDIIFE